MRYEPISQPVLPFHKWLIRAARSASCAFVLVGVMLLFGTLGYHIFNHLPWIDALLDASMILAGMGPVAPLTNNTAKLFASFYALLSGFVIIGTTGIILAPWLHRMLHYLYQELPKPKEEKTKKKE
jgi:hypothetical protein